MSKLKRSTKSVVHVENIRWSLDGCTLQVAADVILELKAIHGDSATLDIDVNCDSGYIRVVGTRPESEAELAERQAYHDKTTQKRADEEMVAYLRVKARMEAEEKASR